MTTIRAARLAMGTRFEVVLRGADPLHLQAVAEDALAEVERLDRRWSAFRRDSDIADLNRRAAQEPVQVDAPLMGLLQRARRLWDLTEGAFDPALGRLMDHWGFRSRGEPGPGGSLPSAAAAGARMQHVALDPEQRQVRFLAPGLQLDLGAIGKGAAVDCAVELCLEAGVPAGLVHAGTSSVRAFGEVTRGRPWKIGIPTVQAARRGRKAAELHAHPSPEELLARVVLRDAALGLSAPWGRESQHDEGGVGHILDPHKGTPAFGVDLAAVIAPHAEEADALATALIVGGETLQARLAASHPEWSTLLLLASGSERRDQPRLIGFGKAFRDVG